MSRDRAHWPGPNIKLLLDLCLAEKEKYNMISCGSLSTDGWNNVEAAFKERGLDYTKRQAQNKLGYLKKRFDNWKGYQNSSGLGRNPKTGAVVADDEWFESQQGSEDGMQEGTQSQDPLAPQQPRGTPPPFLDEMYALWGSRNKNRGTFVGAGGVDAGAVTPPRMPQELHGTSSVGTSSKRSERDQDVTSPKKKKACDLSDFMQTISESIQERSSRGRRRPTKADEHEEVMQILREDGIEEGTDLYFMALDLFRTEDCRAQFW